MSLQAIREEVYSIRKHLNTQFQILTEASNMLFLIEEKMMDYEDANYDRRFLSGSIKFLETATQNYVHHDEGSDGCGDYNMITESFRSKIFQDKKVI